MRRFFDDFKREIQHVKGQIEAKGKRLEAETRVQKNIFTIRATLEALQRASDGHADPILTDELKKYLIRQLWPALPSSIASVDYGGGTLNRDTNLPEEKHINWNLKQIDDHARMLSKQIGQGWKPIIK